MSPRDVVARLKSLDIDWMAITDHNSLANCPAYAAVARKAGIFFTWGVEIQTAEEIHLLAYFDDPAKAQAFDRELYNSLLPLPNDPDFFGDQVIIDENEGILGMEPKALMNSSLWDLSTTVKTARAFMGYCVPAHIDAGANSVLSQLGFLPPEPVFDLFGITANLDSASFLKQHPELNGKAFLRASDAHYLSDLGSGCTRLYLEAPSAAELALAAQRRDHRLLEI